MIDTHPNGIAGKQVLLRAICRSDLETLRRYVNDPDLMFFSNQYHPITDHQQEHWFEELGKELNSVWFGIADIRDTKPVLIGTCCLVGIDWITRLAELRIRIGQRAAWGQRMGTEACQLLLCYGFKQLNLERIWLRVFETNERALRMYSSLGFQVEGKLRQASFINGCPVDVILMGLLRPEWLARAGDADGEGPMP